MTKPSISPGSPFKFEQIRALIHRQIRSGQFEPGQRLPSERDLSKQLQVNHQTVRRALAALMDEGVVVKRPTVGCFVAELPVAIEVAIVMPQWMRHCMHRHPLPNLVLAGTHRRLNQDRYTVSSLFYRHGRLWQDAGVPLAARRARAALVWPQSSITIDGVRRFLDAGIHVALLREHPPHLLELGLACFRFNRDAAFSQILRRLIELGHRRIAIIEYTAELPRARAARHDAGKAIVQEAGLGEWSSFLVPISNPDGNVDLSRLPALLDRRRRPTAIIAHDELIANEIIRLCYQRNLRIPDDMSLAALADSQPESHATPLTAPDTVWLTTRAAELAADYLARAIAGEKPEASEIILHRSVQWTDSIGPPPSNDHGLNQT